MLEQVAECADGELTVSSVAVPLASRINKKDLRIQNPLVVVCEVVAVLVVVGIHRAPSELTVVAAVVERGCTGRGSYDGQVCLVLGTTRTSEQPEYPDETRKPHPSLRHEATKSASASASF